MKAFFIAAIILFAAVVSVTAAPVDPKLRGLSTTDDRKLGSLLNLDLTADILNLIDVILKVNVKDAVSVKLCLDALNLLSVDLKIHLGVIGGCPADLVHIGANVSVTECLAIIAKIKLNIADAGCCCEGLDAIDVLIKLLNDILCTLTGKRSLGGNGGGLLGGLLNIDLRVTIPGLINICLDLDTTNTINVSLTLRALSTLKLNLEAVLLGHDCSGIVDIGVNLTVQQLLAIIAKINVNDVTSVYHGWQACNQLISHCCSLPGGSCH